MSTVYKKINCLFVKSSKVTIFAVFNNSAGTIGDEDSPDVHDLQSFTYVKSGYKRQIGDNTNTLTQTKSSCPSELTIWSWAKGSKFAQDWWFHGALRALNIYWWEGELVVVHTVLKFRMFDTRPWTIVWTEEAIKVKIQTPNHTPRKQRNPDWKNGDLLFPLEGRERILKR